MSDVDQLLEERGQQWGNAISTHERIAAAWTATLGHIVNPVDAALMMIQLKVIRAQINPDEKDSFDDIEGYARIAKWVMGHEVCPELQGTLPF